MIHPQSSQESGEREDRELAEECVQRIGESQPLLSTPSIVETEFAETADGTLVELIEDPENSARTLLAIYREGEVHYASRFQLSDRVLVPIPRNEFAIRDVQLSRGAKRCESPAAVARQICSLFSQCLDLDQANCYLLALFVLSTWFIDLLPVAPYIAFVGLSGTGKSTALRLLRLLCRRALLTANIRTSFYRVCRRLTPTLLVDETDTAGDKRVLGLLRMGTTRDIVALRPQESFTAFGAKAFCWTELPHDAGLNRRCLIIPLHETHRNDFKKPSSPEIIEAAEELQQQLLWLRFKKYKSFSALPKIQGDDELYSHSRDLYEALALVS